MIWTCEILQGQTIGQINDAFASLAFGWTKAGRHNELTTAKYVAADAYEDPSTGFVFFSPSPAPKVAGLLVGEWVPVYSSRNTEEALLGVCKMLSGEAGSSFMGPLSPEQAYLAKVVYTNDYDVAPTFCVFAPKLK